MFLKYGDRAQVREMIQGVRDDAEHVGATRLIVEADEALADLENGHRSVAVGATQGFIVISQRAN